MLFSSLFKSKKRRKDERAPDRSQKSADYNIDELLPRPVLSVTDDETRSFYYGKTVLITGGGGSIGSEIAREISLCHPGKLIIFDINENNAYNIQQELLFKYGGSLDLAVEIGSVRDEARLDAIFSHYRPEVVFHAAAHKHVPLMEHAPAEAVKNNCIGTYNTANAAEKYEAQKFILISTDKAVDPSSIMGASKRLCEMIVGCRLDSKTSFSAVRFGNVLGSDGSVVPLFKMQIENGGPLTLTDKRAVRYFMTLCEAAGLVIKAGAKAIRGELFVLNVGEPVRIYDLALNMIKHAGLVPYTDIDIKEIGLRPGEKLYEQMLTDKESASGKYGDMIYVEKDEAKSREEIDGYIRELTDAIDQAKNELFSTRIRDVFLKLVPTFRQKSESRSDERYE